MHNAHKLTESDRFQIPSLIVLAIALLLSLTITTTIYAQDDTAIASEEEQLLLLEDIKPEVEHTIRPPNLGLQAYIVVQGDTLSGIAATFGLKQKTLIWANPALQADPARLSIGQELWIPPLDGALHTIASGDTLIGIVRKYGVSVEDITGCFYNPILDPQLLRVGDQILVPGASRAVHQPRQTRFVGSLPANAPVGSGEIIWPVKGYLTQGYHQGHYAIDIGSWKGKPIVAADAGFVIRAGWDDSGYGFILVIDHGNGMQTLYAHLDDFRVAAGDAVEQGQTIGLMGASGNTTGVHLHFEVIVDGIRQNPFDYLP